MFCFILNEISFFNVLYIVSGLVFPCVRPLSNLLLFVYLYMYSFPNIHCGVSNETCFINLLCVSGNSYLMLLLCSHSNRVLRKWLAKRSVWSVVLHWYRHENYEKNTINGQSEWNEEEWKDLVSRYMFIITNNKSDQDEETKLILTMD